MSASLIESLREREQKVSAYFAQPRFKGWFKPQDLEDAIFAYLNRPGKRLRPAVLMWSCGAVGGNEDLVLPAAAGVELFHTWTLVHDDLIDNDDLRRGGPTIHRLGETHARERLGYSEQQARDYGRDLAVLTGDSQHGWTISLFCDCALQNCMDANVVLAVINQLESVVVKTLIEGEILDVQYSRAPIESLSREEIVRMLWMKTGALYEFAARAGAMLGLGTRDTDHPYAAALAGFASECGTAFQLQDDILGLTGKEQQLGKPIGSDVREGKKTTIVYYALQEASPEERAFLLSVLGDQQASDSDVSKATELMVSLGAVKKTADLALEHVRAALPKLDTLPESHYRELLSEWARLMVERKF